MGHLSCLVIGEHTYDDLMPWIQEQVVDHDEDGKRIIGMGKYHQVEYFEPLRGFFRYLPGAQLKYDKPEHQGIHKVLREKFLKWVPDMVESIDTPDQAAQYRRWESCAYILRRFEPYDQIDIGHLDLDAMDRIQYDKAWEDYEWVKQINEAFGINVDAIAQAFDIRDGESQEEYCSRQKWHVAAILDMVIAAKLPDHAWDDDHTFRFRYRDCMTWEDNFSRILRRLQDIYPECIVTLYHCSQ